MTIPIQRKRVSCRWAMSRVCQNFCQQFVIKGRGIRFCPIQFDQTTYIYVYLRTYTHTHIHVACNVKHVPNETINFVPRYTAYMVYWTFARIIFGVVTSKCCTKMEEEEKQIHSGPRFSPRFSFYGNYNSVVLRSLKCRNWEMEVDRVIVIKDTL